MKASRYLGEVFESFTLSSFLLCAGIIDSNAQSSYIIEILNYKRQH